MSKRQKTIFGIRKKIFGIRNQIFGTRKKIFGTRKKNFGKRKKFGKKEKIFRKKEKIFRKKEKIFQCIFRKKEKKIRKVFNFGGFLILPYIILQFYCTINKFHKVYKRLSTLLSKFSYCSQKISYVPADFFLKCKRNNIR